MSPIPLVICGAGGFAREVLALVRAINGARLGRYSVVGFIDDDRAKKGTFVHGLPVFETLAECSPNRRVAAALGVGNPALKRQFAERIGKSAQWPNLIHPNVKWDKNDAIIMGKGCIICSRNVLTTDITFGDFVTANLGCTFGHDVRVSDFTTILPGSNISGNVRLGCGVTVGTNSTIIEKNDIGDGATVGAGAVVTKHVLPHTVVVGAPAKERSHRA